MLRKLLALRLLVLSVILLSCAAPVLNREYMREGSREVSFQRLRENPDKYQGTLFVLGGIIVQTKLTAAGAQIEAIYASVDSSGYFNVQGSSEGRFLAVIQGDAAILDPEVYRKGRKITLAGRFDGLQTGRIDEMEYVYPVFAIQQIYLWPEESPYYPAPYYYNNYWLYPYPYYWGPWWQYPYYYRVPPLLQHSAPPEQPPQSPEQQPKHRQEREPEREREHQQRD
jgi:outer membrane lipoprotein